MQSIEKECEAGSSLKKKRPERQLYVPPAQRRLPTCELPEQSNIKKDHGSSAKTKKQPSRKRELLKKVEQFGDNSKFQAENLTKPNETSLSDSIESKGGKITEDYTLKLWKYELFEPSFRIPSDVCSKLMVNFKNVLDINLDGVNIFELRKNLYTLYILGNDYVFWQPKINFEIGPSLMDFNLRVIPPNNPDVLIEDNAHEKIALTELLFPKKTYLEILMNFSIHYDFDVFLLKKDVEPYNFLDVCCSGYYYLIDSVYNEIKPIEELISDMLLTDKCHDKNTLEIEKQANDRFQRTNISSVIEKPQSELLLLKNNSISNANYYKNTINFNEKNKEKNDHEEEKEIMRKTKENINRKTRPIIKYVDELNDTLKIGKNDVNNWEDLFDEDGRLQEDLLKEMVHKDGENVTVFKAKEDYWEYFSKQLNVEELEHMVELYDFPATLETHDLIHAFSEIKSDAIYVKWVDDTHAILVLGSSSQAQKAINVQNPLIKVRPMTAASKKSILTAYKNDLKPAMKRPPTNLQTARRLITTHLGTKSVISKEKSAKERDDLKAAREMKKLVKKNEQDAWEGNLRSSIS